MAGRKNLTGFCRVPRKHSGLRLFAAIHSISQLRQPRPASVTPSILARGCREKAGNSCLSRILFVRPCFGPNLLVFNSFRPKRPNGIPGFPGKFPGVYGVGGGAGSGALGAPSAEYKDATVGPGWAPFR